MPLTGLTPSVSVTFSERYPSPRRDEGYRPSGREDEASAEAHAILAEFGTAPENDESPTPDGFSTVIKTDLSALGDADLWIVPKAPPPNPQNDARPFLSCFSRLLTAVQNGDAAAAREAANALQYELFGGAEAAGAPRADPTDSPKRMLDDINELIRSARLGDIAGAESAARLLASDLQSGLLAAPAPSNPAANRRARPRAFSPHETRSLVQGATAAYETLMDSDAGAA